MTRQNPNKPEEILEDPEVLLERYKQERAKAREVLEKLRTALSEALINS